MINWLTVHELHFKQGKSCWYPVWMANHPQEHLSHWWLKETMSTELPSNPWNYQGHTGHLCYHQLTSHTSATVASSVAWLKQGPLNAYSNAASVQHYVLLLINFQRHHKSDTSRDHKALLKLKVKGLMNSAFLIHMFLSPSWDKQIILNRLHPSRHFLVLEFGVISAVSPGKSDFVGEHI